MNIGQGYKQSAEVTALPDVDIDSTAGCPPGVACEVCGWTAGCMPPPIDDCPVVVGRATVSTPVGVLCIVICNYCMAVGKTPKLSSWGAAIERVGQHCVHLGINDETVDWLVSTAILGRHVWYPEQVAALVAAGFLVDDGPVAAFPDRRYYVVTETKEN